MENIETLRIKYEDLPEVTTEELLYWTKRLKEDCSQAIKTYPSLSASEKKKHKELFMKQEEDFKKVALFANGMALFFKKLDKACKEAARALAKAKKVIEEN